MTGPTPPRPRAMCGALDRLDRVFGVDPGMHGPWFWLVPLAVLVGTIGAFLVIGAVTRAPLEVSLPNGVVIALVMSGLSVACMTPAPSGGDGGDPPDDGGPQVLGSPGGPWVVVAHLGRNSGRVAEREPAGR